MRYVRPNSLTWWAGLLAMLTGIASLVLPATGPLGEVSRLVAKTHPKGAMMVAAWDKALSMHDPGQRVAELIRIAKLMRDNLG